ncbi:MAG: hotdog fold domain-containing protein [Pseudomonadota bacterium]
MNLIATFEKMSRYPMGKALFSRAVAMKAPYFTTIRPRIEELTATRCVVSMPKRRAVHNHIATVHAIAMCNLCELTMGVLAEAVTPRSMRWIPKGMSVRYLKKAETNLTGTAEWPGVAEGFKGDIVVPVKVRDTAGQIVMDADITLYLSPKK